MAHLLTKFSDYVLKFSESIEREHINPSMDVKLYVASTNNKLRVISCMWPILLDSYIYIFQEVGSVSLEHVDFPSITVLCFSFAHCIFAGS